MKVGVFVALPNEARAIFGSKHWISKDGLQTKVLNNKGLELKILIGGQGKEGVAKVSRFFSEKISLLINFGVAGALSNDLSRGMIVVPEVLKTYEGELDISKESSFVFDFLSRNYSYHTRNCNLYSSKFVVCHPDEKYKLYRQTDACAVDMEAYFLGKTCKHHSVKFICIKAISDLASQSLSKDIIKCIESNGNVNFNGLILELLKRPYLIKELILLGYGFKMATLSLKNVANIILDQRVLVGLV